MNGGVAPLLLGAMLGAGLLLAVSPWLWPTPARAAPPGRAGARLAGQLAAAGFGGMSSGLFAAVSVVLAAVAGALVEAVAGVPVLALIAAACGGLAPLSVARWRAAARLKAHRTLWPDVVDHLVAAVRAGRPMTDALCDLAEVGPVPFRAGFALFERRWRASGTIAPALDALKEHFADATADRLIETLRMAREVGGTELPAVLRDLAAHLRQDLALRAEAEARQSWVTNAAKLGVVAPWLVLLMLATRPEAAAAYNSPGGFALMLGALAVTVAAYRGMLAIGRLPEDRRWFG